MWVQIPPRAHIDNNLKNSDACISSCAVGTYIVSLSCLGGNDMIAKTRIVPSSPEGLGEEATTSWGIEKIAAIFDRTWKWLTFHRNDRCPKYPSLHSNSCGKCQELEEEYGMNAPYSDSEFNMPPHSPEVRSMTKKLVILMITGLKQWGVLDLQYPTGTDAKEFKTLTHSR